MKKRWMMAISAALAGLAQLDVLAQTYIYSGGSGNWSDTSKWTPAEVPDGVGVVVERTGTASGNVTLAQDIEAGVTVGTLRNSTDGSFGITAYKAVTLNQDGAGGGTALITLTGTHANSRLTFNNAAGGLILADDLAVTQSNTNSTQTGGAINFTVISGTGDITCNNMMNDLTHGQINFTSNIGSAGTLTIASGAVRGQGAGPFGGAGNAINLGLTDGTSASLLGYRSGNQTIANGITVAAAGGGNRAVLGSTYVDNTGTTTFSGAMTLNGDLTVTSQTADTALGVVLSGKLSGDGGLFINGTFKSGGADLTTTGTVRLSGANTFTGATVISAGTLKLTHKDCLASATDVSIAVGAAMILDHSETNVVNTLALGGAPQPIGVYNSANASPYISGSGFLRTTHTDLPPKGTFIRIQ